MINFTFDIKIAGVWNDISCQLAKENKKLSALWDIVVSYDYHAIASVKAGSEVYRAGSFNSLGVCGRGGFVVLERWQDFSVALDIALIITCYL